MRQLDRWQQAFATAHDLLEAPHDELILRMLRATPEETRLAQEWMIHLHEVNDVPLRGYSIVELSPACAEQTPVEIAHVVGAFDVGDRLSYGSCTFRVTSIHRVEVDCVVVEFVTAQETEG